MNLLLPGLRLGVVALIWAVASGAAQAQSPAAAKPPACVISAASPSPDQSFKRTAARLADGKPIKIVAVGSSSTAGTGATSTAASYPSRLEALLKERFPAVPVSVLNRGIGGQEAIEMLARLNRDVISEKPDLVLWQVGTNALLRAITVSAQAPLLRQGIARMKATGADVVLIDPQYAPKVLARPQADRMVELIGAEARSAGAGVFRRFALMRDWYQAQRLPFQTFMSADGLHMNDWGYDCIARHLAAAIIEAAAGPAQTATLSTTAQQ